MPFAPRSIAASFRALLLRHDLCCCRPKLQYPYCVQQPRQSLGVSRANPLLHATLLGVGQVLNLLFFLAPYDVAVSFLDVVGHLKTFRAIWMCDLPPVPLEYR